MNTEQITISETNENSPIRWMFYIELAVLIALVFVRNVLKAEIPVSVFLALTAIIALLGTKEEIVTLGICCIPLSTAFQYKYTLLICILVYGFKYPKDIKLNQHVFPLLCMMVWEFVHALAYDFTLNEYFRSFSEMIFCTFLMLCTYKKYDYGKICRILAVCTICLLFMLLINLLKEVNFQRLFQGEYRLGVEIDRENYDIGYNPNTLGYMCLLSIAGLLQLVVAKQQRTSDYVLMALLLFFGVLTKSRSFLISGAVLLLMFIWCWKPNVSGRIKNFFLVAVIVTAVIIVLLMFMPYVLESIFGRFQEKDISNGRADLFAFYNEHIFSDFKYLYFGVGLQDMRDKIQAIYGINVTVWNTTHNGIQEIVLVWGLPGLFMFAMYIWSILSSSKEVSGKRTLVSFMPLLLTLLKAQAGQLITANETMLAFSFIYIGLCMNFKGEKHHGDD